MKLMQAAPAPVETIREEFDRLFDRFFNPAAFGAPARIASTMWSPSVDFSENEKEYIVRLEAAGIPKEDIEVNLDGQTLTLSGRREFEKEEKTEEYFWREREAGRFLRTIQLPTAVDAAKVTAVHEGGIMTVRLPKAEPRAKTRVPVR